MRSYRSLESLLPAGVSSSFSRSAVERKSVLHVTQIMQRFLGRSLCSSLTNKSCHSTPKQCFRNYASFRKGTGDSKVMNAFSWKSFGLAVGCGSVFFGYSYYLKEEKKKLLEAERNKTIGKASIGGRFDLIDQNGKRVTSEDFLGKWVLLYFGFTHCPDICPEEMEKMVKVIDILEKQGVTQDTLVPVFISVDPERDTPAVVKSYIAEFSNKLIGLTGSVEKVNECTKNFRVYYSLGPKDEANDYIVDHTIIMYLLDPDGRFVDYYGQLKTADMVASGIAISMATYKTIKGEGSLLDFLRRPFSKTDQPPKV